MNRLIEKIVFFGFVTACRFAICPTRRSPLWLNPTTDGVVRAPSEFWITTASPPSITATHELVVPRSMPIILLLFAILLLHVYDFCPFATAESPPLSWGGLHRLTSLIAPPGAAQTSPINLRRFRSLSAWPLRSSEASLRERRFCIWH